MVTFTKQRLEEIFEGFKNKKILVIGDLMVDEYLRGNVNRLSPEAPVPVVEIEQETYHLGGAANVSINLKTLGCHPITLGLVGNDRAGDILVNLIKEAGMVSDGIIVATDRPTTLKTRIIGDNQHIARVDREKVEYATGPLLDQLIKRSDELLSSVEAIVLEDYNKGVLAQPLINHVTQKAQELGKPILVDPKFVNFLEYRGVTVFKPNVKETVHALGKPLATDSDVEQAGQELLNLLQAECVLITRGGKGMSLIEKGPIFNHIPTRTRKVADVSGAGDTVISTMAAALSGGANFKEAATLANYAAGLVCEEVGIVPIQRNDLFAKIMKENVNHDGNR